jgi:Lon protease-like protein
MLNIPVFPLPVFLLPQGITRLKIFEPRYLNMISIAAKNKGFAIVLNELIGQSTMTASWVEVINFDKSESGILIVDVKCKGLISLVACYKDEHNLMWASYTPLSHWQALTHNASTKMFSQLLRSFFQQNEALLELYHDEFIDTPNWVMCRWLELLPLKTKDKLCFLTSDSDQQAKGFLSDLLLPENSLAKK